MIREDNTLEWQETAEQKRMTQRRIIQRRERARRRKRKVWRIRGLLLLFGCLLFGRCAALPAESDPTVCESKRHFNGSVPGGAVVALREKQ